MPFLLPAILFFFGGVALRDVTRGIEYRIVGIFRSGKSSFSAGPEIFVRFIFVLV